MNFEPKITKSLTNTNMNMERIVSTNINRKVISMIINMDKVASMITTTNMTTILKKIININILMIMEAKASV